MEQHLALGGCDRPSEVLLSFFHRYGGVADVGSSDASINQDATTDLTQYVTLSTNGAGSADLQPVFKLKHC
eukprot:15101540-Ditylum_brightwellii.AAC.1